MAGCTDVGHGEARKACIAWRMWHIGVDCMRSYRVGFFGVELPETDDQLWPGTAAEGVRAMEAEWAAFRVDVAALGDEKLGSAMGPQARRYAESTFLALVLHALDEVIHHSAELGLLRDLYPHLS